MQDVPDIAIEFKDGKTILIDAKNSPYTLSESKPNLYQMRFYMTTVSPRYGIFTHRMNNALPKIRGIGIFVHSESEDPDLKKEVINEKDGQKIIWTSLVPGDKLTSSQNLKSIIELIRKSF
jgi:hypothetical protein